MVLPGLGEERGTSLNRFKCLHNFTSPSFKWVSQRRTNEATANAGDSGGSELRSPAEADDSNVIRKRELEPERNQAANARCLKKKQTRIATPPRIIDGDGDGEDDYGFEAVRQKLILDLKTAAERMKDAILRNDEEEPKSPPPPPVGEAPAAIVKPWNLRTRRAECDKALVAAGGCGKGLKIDEKKPNCSSPAARIDDGAVKLPKRRSNSDKTQRVKFSVELSKNEVEEDFRKMVGHLPPRKPNKRPRVLQKQLDILFPGLWLTGVTADSYKVPESPKMFKVRPSRNGKGKGKDASLQV